MLFFISGAAELLFTLKTAAFKTAVPSLLLLTTISAIQKQSLYVGDVFTYIFFSAHPLPWEIQGLKK